MPSAVDVTEVNIVLAPPLICLPRRLPLTASSSYRPLCLHCPAVPFTPRPIHAHTFHSIFFLSPRPPLANRSRSSLSSFTPLLFPVQFLNLSASLLPLCLPPPPPPFLVALLPALLPFLLPSSPSLPSPQLLPHLPPARRPPIPAPAAVSYSDSDIITLVVTGFICTLRTYTST